MKSLLFFCLSTFLFYSCSKKENSLYPIIDLADAIENPVEKSVYDVAESVEVVQLETNDSLLIPYVSQLIMTDQYFIIGYGKKCSLFSHSGKFVCDIAQKGSGPEEYTMLMNLLYINNRVLITDLNNKVNVYSLNGKFIESYQALPEMFSAIYPMSDKNFIVQRLKEVGDWMSKYGETIYGTRGGLVAPHDWGVTTQKGNKLYVHILNLQDKALFLPIVDKKVKKAVVFADKTPVRFTKNKEGIVLELAKVPTDVDYVVELTID